MTKTQIRQTVYYVQPPRRSLWVPVVALIAGAVVVGVGLWLALGVR